MASATIVRKREREREVHYGEFDFIYAVASTFNVCVSPNVRFDGKTRKTLHSIYVVYTQHSTCTFHVVSVICSRLVSSGKVTARILDPSLMYSEKEDFEYLSGSSFGSRSRSGTDTLVRDVQDRETDAMMELRSIL